MNRVLIVDGQVFQTPALYRGMGKYTKELLSALILQNKSQKIWSSIELILSTEFGSEYDVYTEVGDVLSNLNVVSLPLLANRPGVTEITNKNRHIIDAYCNTRHNTRDEKIDFFIPAIFQSQICPVYPSRLDACKILLMHDLIPLTFFHYYLGSEDIRVEYLTKLSECFKSDVFMTNSKTVANDIAEELGISPDRIIAILGGAIDHANEIEDFKIDQPFILMPAGNDTRKNNRRGVEGFELFNAQHNNKYKLALTSFYLPHEIEELSGLSDDIVFTGNISGAQMQSLFQTCELLLFPSEYEGLGLPILEAMQQHKAVACSDISVFREMSNSAYCYFDFTNPKDISDGIERALHMDIDTVEYERVLDEFSWPRVAQRFIEGLSVYDRSHQQSFDHYDVYAPDISHASPAGEITRRLIPTFSYYAPKTNYFSSDIHVGSVSHINYIPYLWPFTRKRTMMDGIRTSSHIPIYIVDNHPASAEVVCQALAAPGILILCDNVLDKVWEYMRESRLVSSKRYEIEKKLSSTFLTTICDRQYRVISVAKNVHDKSVEHVKLSKHIFPYPDLIKNDQSTNGEKYSMEYFINSILERRIK